MAFTELWTLEASCWSCLCSALSVWSFAASVLPSVCFTPALPNSDVSTFVLVDLGGPDAGSCLISFAVISACCFATVVVAQDAPVANVALRIFWDVCKHMLECNMWIKSIGICCWVCWVEDFDVSN